MGLIAVGGGVGADSRLDRTGDSDCENSLSLGIGRGVCRGGWSTRPKVLAIQAYQGSRPRRGGVARSVHQAALGRARARASPPPGMALGRVGSMGRAWGVKVGKLGGWGNHPRRQVGLRSRTLMTHPTPPNFGV